MVAAASGVLFRLRSDGHILERSSSATRVTALRDLGAGKMLMVTKGTLRMISIDHADEARPGLPGSRASGRL